MGAAFSPTVANIYMSITLSRFLSRQPKQPLLVRYIDDIFLIWTHSEEELKQFLSNFNDFNPALHYTHDYSFSNVNFLDVTIFKSFLFPFTNLLDRKTFQKDQNLYQYLHYSFNHEKSRYKAIISGELVRKLLEPIPKKMTTLQWSSY